VIGSFSGARNSGRAGEGRHRLLISAAICLPSLYIFACLSGSTARLAEVVGSSPGCSS